MKIILSTIEDSYAESHVLKKEWHDFASSFSFNRQKSFLGGRALLQESLSEFYGVDSLPQITTLSHGKPVFFESRYPFFNISHSSKLICLAIGDRELGLDVEYIKPRRNNSIYFSVDFKRVSYQGLRSWPGGYQLYCRRYRTENL